MSNIVYEAGRKYDIGPGAPSDLERIESGLLSYGADARRQTHPATPYNVGLGKLVGLDRSDDFIDKAAPKKIASKGQHRRRVGFFIDGPALAGNDHQLLVKFHNKLIGVVSDICYPPKRGINLGVGQIDAEIDIDIDGSTIELGGRPRSVTATTLPFA